MASGYDDPWADSRDDGRSREEMERARAAMRQAPALRFSEDHDCYRAYFQGREVRVTREQFWARYPEFGPYDTLDAATKKRVLEQPDEMLKAKEAALAWENWLDDRYTYTPKPNGSLLDDIFGD